mmetsp:Transcript_44424/g.44936  ORF Transcript_44424/g.44936 Transcript_44424/m.44936 type:complete len:96 (+) Transcript_44424:222-509(+)
MMCTYVKKIALNQDYISATTLDVMETEPLQTLSLLWEYTRVVVSLHVSDTCIRYSGAFLAAEYVEAMERKIAKMMRKQGTIRTVDHIYYVFSAEV